MAAHRTPNDGRASPGVHKVSDTLRTSRRRLGAWYTPAELVAQVVRAAIPAGGLAGRRVRVLDPACGDGRFLVQAGARIRELGGEAELVGVDLDPDAVDAARRALVGQPAEIRHADALGTDWGDERFDVVIGNPPFLSQLAADTTRRGASRHGGGPYADAAVEFLALALRLARPAADGRPGGRIGLVLPLSCLASRDAGAVRRLVAEQAALRWLWWSPTHVFDAQVRTCAMVLEVGGDPAGVVPRAVGPTFASAPCLLDARLADVDGWGAWIAGDLGVPELARLRASGTLGQRAVLRANFRDEYYGLVGAVREQAGPDDAAPPLVTTGLVDPGRCRWGETPVRFAKQRFERPVVDRAALSPQMQRWAAAKLVPKVLIGTQTRVLEAVADPEGAWLPAVPLITAVPLTTAVEDDVWAVAAVLTSPVASAWTARRCAGTGLSAGAMRVSVHALADLPWPAGELGAAVAALRAGDVEACGAAVDAAYGVAPGSPEAAALLGWWLSGARERRATRRPPSP
jgi:hypothetical protein